MDTENKSYYIPSTIEEMLMKYGEGIRHFGDFNFDDQVYDLSGLNLDNITLQDGYLFASFANTSLKRSKFINMNLKTCDFSNANLGNAVFNNVALDAVVWKGAQLKNTKFIETYEMGHKIDDELLNRLFV